MKSGLNDLAYLLNEMKGLLNRVRTDMPEDFYKIYNDLIYHSEKALKEMEVEYVKFIETRDCSVCELHRLSR